MIIKQIERDHSSLSYSLIIFQNNYAWLSAAGLEREVSNKEMMQKLVFKFLWEQVEK